MMDCGPDTRACLSGDTRLFVYGKRGHRHPLLAGFKFMFATFGFVTSTQYQAINGGNNFLLVLWWY
jgi:hypothetical protein